MKWYKLIMAFFVCVFTINVNAKNSLPIDTTYFSIIEESFEPYEQVLLKGTYNVQMVKSIKLSYQFNNMPNSVNVAMANGTWSAPLGSFLPGQSVILNFDVQIEAGKEKIFELRKDFITNFFETLESLDNARVKEDSQTSVLQEKIILGMEKRFSDDYVIFKDEKGKSIKEYIVKAISETASLNELDGLKNEISDVISNINDGVNELKSSNASLYNSTSDSIKAYFTSNQKSPKLYRIPIDKNDTDSIKGIKEIVNAQLEDFDSLKNKQQALIEQIVPSNFLASIPFQSNLQSNKELKFVLKNFIGFELMPAYFIDRNLNSTFGLFFTASPYFGWTDPDEKIFQNCKYRTLHNDTLSCKEALWRNLTDKDFLNNIRRFVTPTFGFGLTSSPKTNQPMPLVYAGLGFRMNNIVRVSVGKTFYTKKYTDPADGSDPEILSGSCWTVGVGISTDYLSDFMKVFSTTVNQYGK